jgi:HEAT repeat protein
MLITEDGEVPLHSLPVADLVAAALAVDEDTRPEYTAFLHLRGDQETFEAARSLCAAADPVRRELGAYVLGQLGAIRLSADGTTVGVPRDQRPFRTPATTLLLDLAATETVDGVRKAIAIALGHLADLRAVETLGRWRAHPEVDVRWSVSIALTPLASDDDNALRYLAELTSDPDPLVRDWSCFGLYQAGRDTPEVRQALLSRIDDDDVVTRAEALRALADFGEARAVQPLLDALDRAVHADDPTGEAAGLLEEARSLLATHISGTGGSHGMGVLG